MVTQAHEKGDKRRGAQPDRKVFEVDGTDHQWVVPSRLRQCEVDEVASGLEQSENPQGMVDPHPAEEGPAHHDSEDRRKQTHPALDRADIGLAESGLEQERCCHVVHQGITHPVDHDESEDQQRATQPETPDELHERIEYGGFQRRGRFDGIRRVGRTEGRDEADQHEGSHDQVHRRPRHPVGQDQRAGPGEEHRDAVAENIHGGAGTHFTFL